MVETARAYGFVVLARSEPRLLAATLESIRLSRKQPDVLVVVIPKTREHVFASVRQAATSNPGIHVLCSDVYETSPLAMGVRFVAGQVGVAIVASEGVVLDPGYLTSVCCSFEDWADLVGQIDLVDRIRDVDVRTDTIAGSALLMPPGHRWKWCAALRARSLMSSILAVRLASCRNIPIGRLPDGHDWVAFSILLDELQGRGRTVAKFTDHAFQIRLSPERRDRFDDAYSLYELLSRLRELGLPSFMAQHVAPSYVNPRLEKMRLLADQIEDLVVSPGRGSNAMTFIRGMLAARRDVKARRRRLRREIRDLA